MFGNKSWVAPVIQQVGVQPVRPKRTMEYMYKEQAYRELEKEKSVVITNEFTDTNMIVDMVQEYRATNNTSSIIPIVTASAKQIESVDLFYTIKLMRNVRQDFQNLLQTIKKRLLRGPKKLRKGKSVN